MPLSDLAFKILRDGPTNTGFSGMGFPGGVPTPGLQPQGFTPAGPPQQINNLAPASFMPAGQPQPLPQLQGVGRAAPMGAGGFTPEMLQALVRILGGMGSGSPMDGSYTGGPVGGGIFDPSRMRS
jgi:hypothetical protein